MKVLALVLITSIMQLATERRVTYKLAMPGYHFTFPRDHGSHPDYQLEWWYYTGQVRTSQGREFGYELTFFRTGLDRIYDNASTWNIREFHIAHFALSDLSNRRFYFFEKLNREGPGIAGSKQGGLHCWNENWSAQFDGNSIRLAAAAGNARVQLELVPEKTPVIHGKDGISQKAAGAGHASHYYSLTRLRTRGTLALDGESHDVQGESWMDHEFGTNQLTEQQVGWDWFSIQLDNGIELMLYRMRQRDGSIDPNSSGTVVAQDSRTRHLDVQQFQATALRQWRSAKTATTYPVDWQIQVASEDADLTVTARMDDQELVTTRSSGIAYWEGAVRITGTWKGRPVTGRGYLELTGYAERFRPKV